MRSCERSGGMYMLSVFQLKDNYLLQIDDIDNISSISNVIWIDIIRSNDYDYSYIQNLLKKYKVNFFKLRNIKETKRFFYDEYGVYIRSFFFSYNDHNQINNILVFFTIYNDCLYTISESRFSLFYIYQKYLHNHVFIDGNAYELFLYLFAIKIDNLTDKIEHMYTHLETLSLVVMDGQQNDEYDTVLSDLAELENIGWKIRINLLDTERAIRFLIRNTKLPTNQKKCADEILHDITFLLPYNECIFHNISFITQSVMGFINIEQNRIIKIFSIVFLPPTLIASSYGMNFDFMPELKWSFGYPSAIILMILTGLVPYLYFKYKHWL